MIYSYSQAYEPPSWLGQLSDILTKFHNGLVPQAILPLEQHQKPYYWDFEIE